MLCLTQHWAIPRDCLTGQRPKQRAHQGPLGCLTPMCPRLIRPSMGWGSSARVGMTTTARGNRCAIVAGTCAWLVMRSRRGHAAKRSARSRTERSPRSSAHKRIAITHACAIPFCTPQRLCPPSPVHSCTIGCFCTWMPRSPCSTSDNPVYVNQAWHDRVGLTLRLINGVNATPPPRGLSPALGGAVLRADVHAPRAAARRHGPRVTGAQRLFAREGRNE